MTMDEAKKIKVTFTIDGERTFHMDVKEYV